MEQVIVVKAQVTFIQKGNKEVSMNKKEVEELIKKGRILPDDVVVTKLQNFITKEK